MPGIKVLITVTTYPLPSRSYDELVCTAGVLEDGSWIRIYPVPLSFLIDLKQGGKIKAVKYTWFELELNKRKDDFRPESHSPKHYDFKDMKILARLDTKSNWLERKKYCLANVYTSMNQLIQDSKAPKNISIATFKPTKIKKFDIDEDERDWKPVWKELRNQLRLFQPNNRTNPSKMIPKVPYKFYYKFSDSEGKESRLMIEDWEIGALYWNCLKQSNGDEKVALQKVKEKYSDDFINNKELFLFLGTTKEWHQRRAKNPFVIIGVFYPKKENQLRLF